MARVAQSEKPKTLSIVEAAKELGIGRSAAYAGAQAGEIPTIRIGKLIRVPRVALDRLLDGSTPGARA